ncbi:MAG: nucleoside triphosphate pyrophosphohydrolase [Deltaproteobacteria bacterium]|jgi:MazG family protein|nr:nucleoside triphosphate pyrophosphohydrolase [Deltaproteobacteria bacterium]
MEDAELNQIQSAIGELYRLVNTLRGDNGCPWDKKQSPETVSIYLIEEVYELVDAIESGSSDQICEELGDLLFHILFVARMFQERGEFDLSDVAQTITDKMIRRHPHVFGEKKINSSEEVIQNWHKIKLAEKKASDQKSLLDSVPPGLPALIRAFRISDRAAKSGLEWMNIAGNLQDTTEMLDKLQVALKNQDINLLAGQFGDLLFTLVNIARLAKIHPESVLAGSIKKFELRFKKMEELVAESKRELSEVTAEEKTLIWDKAHKMVP